jgi:cell division protein FtsB
MTENNGAAATTLDLDALTEPLGNVTIGGVKYKIAQWDSLSLRQRNRLAKISARLAQIEQLDDPSDEESDEYDEINVEAMLIFAPAMSDEAARAELGKVRTAVATFFGMRLVRQSELLTNIATGIPTPTTPNLSNGANGSPGSNRATRRARRKSG